MVIGHKENGKFHPHNKSKKISSDDSDWSLTLGGEEPKPIIDNYAKIQRVAKNQFFGDIILETRKGNIPCEIPPSYYVVFGSNREGRHGKGMALKAKQCWGAKYGQGRGLQGQSYALPTKETPYRSLSEDQVKREVDMFLDYARRNKDKHFLVGAVGTRNAGFSVEFMRSLFKNARNERNITLPDLFM